MRLDILKITNFRNIKSASVEFGEGVNIFTGQNGAGKTNLLEAIFTLCLGRSQRGARDIMLVGDTEDDYYRLEGIGQTSGGEVQLACAFQKGGRKKVTVDENPARISQLFQISSLISMAPEDVALLSGSPSVRRRFMDLHLSQASSGYLADLMDYNKALAQKNSFLKKYSDQDCPFDGLLIQFGSRIMAARENFIQFLKSQAPIYYNQIAGIAADEEQDFDFDYQPDVTYNQKEEMADSFENRLNDFREKEKILETAVVGPHRDDIAFQIGNFPARGYGSQGELRSAVTAILLAAANYLEERRNEKSVLLLDEIFAELDNSHRENLAKLFDAFEQIFLTTAVDPPTRLRDRGKHFHIEEGKVSDR